MRTALAPKENRRQKQRLLHRFRLKYSLEHGAASGYVINQSEHGVYIQGSRLLRPRSHIILFDAQGEVLAKGKVAWNRHGMPGLADPTGGMGIHLLETFGAYDHLIYSLRARQTVTSTVSLAPRNHSWDVLKALHAKEVSKAKGLLTLKSGERLLEVTFEQGIIQAVSGPVDFAKLRQALEAKLGRRLTQLEACSGLVDHIVTWMSLDHVAIEEIQTAYQGLVLERLWSFISDASAEVISFEEGAPASSLPLELSILDVVLQSPLSDAQIWEWLAWDQGATLALGNQELPRLSTRLQRLISAVKAGRSLTETLVHLGQPLTWSKELMACHLYGAIQAQPSAK